MERYIFYVHTRGGRGSRNFEKFYCYFMNSTVIFLRLRGVGEGAEISTLFCGRHKCMVPMTYIRTWTMDHNSLLVSLMSYDYNCCIFCFPWPVISWSYKKTERKNKIKKNVKRETFLLHNLMAHTILSQMEKKYLKTAHNAINHLLFIFYTQANDFREETFARVSRFMSKFTKIHVRENLKNGQFAKIKICEITRKRAFILFTFPYAKKS